MSSQDFNHFLLLASIALILSHFLGHLFSKIKQPRVMAEISVGLILGPSLFGFFFPAAQSWLFPDSMTSLLALLKELGLILLMFCSGAELRHLDPRKHKKSCTYGIILGIGLPALFGGLSLQFLDLSSLIGELGDNGKLKLAIILSMAVTSIPVISRILLDLNLLKSKFAEQVLSIALIEDFILYALLNVVLSKNSEAQNPISSLFIHIAISSLFLGAVIFWRERIFLFFRSFAKKTTTESNHLYLTFILATLFIIIYLTNYLGIVSMISAFCAGMVLGSGTSDRVEELIETVRQFSFAIFIPFYFFMVGYRINLARDFNFGWFLFFFLFSSFLKTLGGYLTGKLSGESRFRSWALGLTLNARGGPGIVIATAAYDQKIISNTLFTTLIITALMTSSLAGSFLDKYKAKLAD
ncbi:MAG: cation:proton antiporter [Bacteriovoracaceae bacterium]